MIILITGSNGFIGYHLATALLKRGHQVVGIGRSKKSKVKNITKYYIGNVLDKKIVTRAMSNVEIVVHLAALTSHKEIIDKKFETLEVNFLGTKNVLDAFSKSQTTKKFFYSSTGKVYGKILKLPISEDHPTNPLNILGKSKLITERLIDFYNTSQKEFILFRIFNIYGPSQKKNFLVPTILSQLVKRKNEITLGDIKSKRDYVYIDDLIRAFVLAIEKKGLLGVSVYNVCTQVGTSAGDIVKEIGEIKGKKMRIKINPDLYRSDEVSEEYGSYQKIKKDFGWEPKTSLRAGLEKTLQ